jgi:hypothetical protein
MTGRVEHQIRLGKATAFVCESDLWRMKKKASNPACVSDSRIYYKILAVEHPLL